MKMYQFVAILMALAAAVPALQKPLRDPLENRIEYALPEFDKTPLSVVLDRISFASGGNLLLFGAEIETREGKEPLISTQVEAGVTIKQALIQVLGDLPGYSFETVSPHVVDVFPIRASTDLADVMNLHVSKVHLDNVPPTTFLGNPSRYIPELKLVL